MMDPASAQTVAATGANEQRRCFGLLSQRVRWGLTWRGWLVVVGVLALAVFFGVRGAHDFLAVNAPVSTEYLVVEGWVPRFSLTNYLARHTNYARIFVTGGPTQLDRDSTDISDTYASVARARLIRAGVPAEKLQMVPSWKPKRDRTYTAAAALREWARTNNVQLKAFNVLTMGPHARRSRFLHQEAFGDGVEIGVVCATNREYDFSRWWRYSEGVKEVISESAGYLYARFLFSPED
jgi:hypothetical protein